MRRTEHISIALIDVDRYPMKRVLGLVRHLEAGGTVPPVHVERTTHGRFRLLDGRHRIMAHRLLERPLILARYGA